MPLNPTTLWNMLVPHSGGLDDESAWRRLASAYRYPREPLPRVREEQVEDPGLHLARWHFQGGRGASHTGLFIRPLPVGRYPCVLLLHALSRNKDEMIRHFGRALAARGIAALALDAHLHGERSRGSAEGLTPLDYLNGARDTIIDYRQAIDYLETRPDVDTSRLGLLGYSLGAMMGCILAAVDSRIGASVFLVGGDIVRTYRGQVPVFLRGMLDPVSPSLFVGHIAPRPVLFINGRRDQKVSHESAELLHHAAGEPREIRWAECGHVLPEAEARYGVEWLIDHLTA